jgi:hypothetical protein
VRITLDAHPHFDFGKVPIFPGSRGEQAGTATAQAIARAGAEGPTQAMPYLPWIQASFGRHDVGEVQAHIAGPAEGACRELGALAYAFGDQVVFRSAPDLHTAAHEAAHVVQQRRGLHLQGGRGRRGDAHERHADAVADRVVRGLSAEPLLDRGAPAAPAVASSAPAIQLRDGDQTEAPDPVGAAPTDVCKDLCDALTDSMAVIALYNQFLSGAVTWEDMQARRTIVGNAAQGVVGQGLNRPKVVQDAIAEVEKFNPSEEGWQMAKQLWSSVVGSDRDLQETWTRNEIDRQTHYNDILLRKMAENACASCGAAKPAAPAVAAPPGSVPHG